MNRAESAAACKTSGGKEEPRAKGSKQDRRATTSAPQPMGCSPVRLLGVKAAPVVDFCGDEACAIGLGVTGPIAERLGSSLELQIKVEGVFGPPIFKKGAGGRVMTLCDGDDDLMEETWLWEADGGGRESVVLTRYCAAGQVGAMLVHANVGYAAHRGDDQEKQFGSYLRALASRYYE
jgi:hypothetical protein